ncbi:MAG: carbohydrate ABC transporter permease [Rubrobacteraceae bacterium]
MYRTEPAKGGPKARGARWFATHSLLLVATLLVAAPLLWMVSMALQDLQAVFSYPPKLLPWPPKWGNFAEAWRAQPFAVFYFNSVVVAVAIIVGQLVTVCLAAYALTQLRFWGREKVFLLILATMMVPAQVTFVPAFLVLKHLGWINTYQALIVPFLTSAFGIFLVRQSFLRVPQSFIDSARVDGAGHLRILWSIMVPLSKPSLATMVLLNFVWHYHDFFWPLVVTNSTDMRTLPIGLAFFLANQGGGEGTPWHLIMAADVFIVAPLILLYFVAQRFITQNDLASGMKG